MGTLFGFLVGYVVGAKAGGRGFDEVVDALRAVRDSEEFRGFVDALRDHVRGTADSLNDKLQLVVGGGGTLSDDLEGLMDAARRRMSGDADR